MLAIYRKSCYNSVQGKEIKTATSCPLQHHPVSQIHCPDQRLPLLRLVVVWALIDQRCIQRLPYWQAVQLIDNSKSARGCTRGASLHRQTILSMVMRLQIPEERRSRHLELLRPRNVAFILLTLPYRKPTRPRRPMALEVVCPQCGKRHRVKRITKRYCSTLCRMNAHNAKKRNPVTLTQPEEQQS
jgi:hypothetical protein